MDNPMWPQVKRWRQAKRAELLRRRLQVSPEYKRRARSAIAERIFDQVPSISEATIGFYWPIKGELDMRDLVLTCLLAGARAALPVVTEKNQPLQFWAWTPATVMTRGFWNVQVPSVSDPVVPSVLLVPLLGFDAAGYRLGYGGGYYDRTLAALSPRPKTLGVGLEACRLASIHPQPHDVPMDAIVTERDFQWR